MKSHFDHRGSKTHPAVRGNMFYKLISIMHKYASSVTLLVSVCLLSSTHAQQEVGIIPVGFKKLILGETYKEISAKTALKCPSMRDFPRRNKSIGQLNREGNTSDKELLELYRKSYDLSQRINGDMECVLLDKETISGMKAESLGVSFFGDRLGKIVITFTPEKDLSTSTGSPFAKRSSSYNDIDFVVAKDANHEMRILVEGLKDRYGPYNSSSKPYCPSKTYSCRDAPLIITHRWTLQGSIVSLEYLGTSYKKTSVIEYKSIEYVAEQMRRETDRKVVENEIRVMRSEIQSMKSREHIAKKLKDL